MVASITVTVAFPQSTLKGTPTSSSHSGTVLCETYIAGRGIWIKLKNFQILHSQEHIFLLGDFEIYVFFLIKASA